MKKLRQIICLAAISFAVISCNSTGKVEFDYVHLVNNETGFMASDGDTAIAIGLKKGSSLKADIDAYLDTLTPTYWGDLMNDMVKLQTVDGASYNSLSFTNDINNGTLKVGMECGYIPYNWSQTSNNNGAVAIYDNNLLFANGYDVQIARGVANALHMKLEIHQLEWEALLPAVQSGAIDCIIAGMSPTEERLKEIDFSSVYYRSNLVIVTRKDSELMNYNSLSELDIKGYKIAAQPGTFHLDALKNQTKNITVIDTLEDFPDMQIALEAGSIDGYVAEEPTALSFVAN